MFKNWKSLFSSLLFLLFLFPSFFFLPSPTHTSLAASDSSSDSRTYPSDSWTTRQRQATLSALQKNKAEWLIFVAYGLKELKFKSNRKDVVFHFDKLAAAFQPQVLKQQHFPNNAKFDLTKIQGEAQKQLFQPYQKGTSTYVDNFVNALVPKMQEHGDLFFESLKPSLKKMKTLGLSKVAVSYWTNFSFTKLFDSIGDSYKNLKSAKNVLANFALLTFSPTPNNAKNVLDNTINKVWTPWLHTLQNAKVFDLTHLIVGKDKVDVSSLVNSKVQEASVLSLEKIKILKNLQFLGFEIFQNQVQNYIDNSTLLNSYKNSIQPTLKNFVNTKIKKIKIKDTLYQVDLLLKESNLKLTGVNLPQVAKNQLSALVKAKITVQTLENALLESYRLTIVNNLNALRDNNISQVVINDKTYSLTELIESVDKNKTVSLLSTPAKTELAVLAKNAITKTQLDTALAIILEAREAVAKKAKALQNQKKSKQKKLIIGLSVGGSALALSSLGGFLYWFFKIKK